MTVTNNPAPAPGIRQIRMGRDVRLDFRLDRLDQQLPGSRAQHLGQGIVGK